MARRLDVILVINKIDRLVLELKLSEEDAFLRIQRLIECVNSCISKILQCQLFEEDWGNFESIEQSLHFVPAKGNVIFISALHGYAFSLSDFITLWARRLSLDQNELCSAFFSTDHYISSKKILTGAVKKGRKPLFVQLVLEPLWELHKCGILDKDLSQLNKLAEKLSLKPLRCKRPEEASVIYKSLCESMIFLDCRFDELMQQWLPLADAVIKACISAKSSETAFYDERILLQICGNKKNRISQFLRKCDPNSSTTLAFVAKYVKLDEKRIAICRVMSGTVSRGLCFYKVYDFYTKIIFRR